VIKKLQQLTNDEILEDYSKINKLLKILEEFFSGLFDTVSLNGFEFLKELFIIGQLLD
jgi:hypothetical protein